MIGAIGAIPSKFKHFIEEFVEEAAKVEGLHSLILFGSVARGEASPASDIDLLAIVEGGEFSFAAKKLREIEAKIERKGREKGPNIELVIMSQEDLRKAEKHFIENIIREGVLLFGKSAELKVEDAELHPFSIFIYYFRGLDAKNRQRLYITLYGHKTIKRVGEKIYTSETKGFIEKGVKLERKVVMFPEEIAREIRKVFEKFRAEYYEIRVYAPWEEFEKLRRIQTRMRGAR